MRDRTPTARRKRKVVADPERSPVSDLKRLRLARGLTLHEAARKARVTATAIWYWERGDRRPMPKYYPMIADAYGVSPLQIVAMFDPPLPGSTFYESSKSNGVS